MRRDDVGKRWGVGGYEIPPLYALGPGGVWQTQRPQFHIDRNGAAHQARRAGGVRTAVVPGSHHMMLREPHVRTLAAALDEELAT